MLLPNPKYAPLNFNQLLDEWEEIGIVKDEVYQIRDQAKNIEHTLYTYLQLAAMVRPTHVFDATYYHACDRTYRYILSQFTPTKSVWGNYGVLMQEWGRYSEAIVLHRKAIELDDTYSNSYLNLGFCYELAGDYKNAKKATLKAIELSGQQPETLTVLGNCERSSGNLDSALKLYEAALQYDISWPDALYMKSFVLAELGRWSEAKDTITNFLDLNPQDESAILLSNEIQSHTPPIANDTPMRPFERWSDRMQNAPKSHWRDDGAWGWVVQVIIQRQNHIIDKVVPKIFISYRWESNEHKSWVRQIADILVRRGYQVVLDQLSPNINDYRRLIEQLGDTDYFVPILTNDYRRRSEAVGDLSSDVRTAVSLSIGRAFDEWAIAMLLANISQLKLIGLWRQGPAVAIPFTPESAIDVRGEDWKRNICSAFPVIGNGDQGSLTFDSYRAEPSAQIEKPQNVPSDLLDGMAKLRVPALQSKIIQST